MLEKRVDDITADDLNALIRDKAEETQRLEFKREADFSKEKDKREFAKDVSGMANGAGGRILYGIDEGASGGGRAVATGIVPVTDPHFVDRANSIIADAITPPVRARIRPIEFQGGAVVIVDVPPSTFDLHMVGAYGETRYYLRTEKSVVPMPEIEVRRAYERIERLRGNARDRVRGIVDAEVKLSPTRTVVLAIPMADSSEGINVTPLNDPLIWFSKDLQLARADTASQLLYSLSPAPAGLEAKLPEGKSTEEAVYVFRLLRGGTVHISYVMTGIRGDFQSLQVLVNLLNVCAWTNVVRDKTGSRGPVRVVLRVPLQSAHEVLQPNDSLEDKLTLRSESGYIEIQREWVPSATLDARVELARAVLDELWHYMGQERCSMYFDRDGGLDRRIKRSLGLG